jgi:hypothetical protein
VDALATIDAKLKGSENNDFLNMASYLEESHFPLTHPLEGSPRFISEEF